MCYNSYQKVHSWSRGLSVPTPLCTVVVTARCSRHLEPTIQTRRTCYCNNTNNNSNQCPKKVNYAAQFVLTLKSKQRSGDRAYGRLSYSDL